MKLFLPIAVLSVLFAIPLCARTLMCEQCEDQPIECDEHLFVERSQVFIHSEFLYWSVKEGALDYSTKMNKSTSADTTFAIGKYETAKYDWCPGFRVALSYYRCPRYWEVSGQYTWLFDKGSDKATKPSDADRFLIPTRQTLTDAPFEKASSHINFHYHLGDVYVARIFDPNPHLRMRMIGGATTAFIEQSWKIRYTNFDDNFDQIQEKWRFFGGGLRFGVTADWFWGYHLYFTGKTTFATLLGSYKNEEVQTNGPDKILLADTSYHDQRFTMHAQFLLGFSWQVPGDCGSFELFAGYEFNIWFNLQERLRTNFNALANSKESYLASSLLGLQGLTVRLTIGF